MTDWESRALVDDNRELKAEVERLQKRIAYQEQVIEQRNAEIARLWTMTPPR